MYPTSIVSYFNKYDEQQVFTNEAHQIPNSGPYTVALTTIPYRSHPSNVVIPGFTEVNASPSVGHFLVNYASGIITFNSADAGTNIVVSYLALGDEVIASHINVLQDELTLIETVLGTNPQGSLADLKTRLAVGINDDGTLKITAPISGEVPGGAIDGSNPSFTLAHSPIPANTPSAVKVFSDGIRVNPNQYTITGTNLSFVMGSVNIPSSDLLVDYSI